MAASHLYLVNGECCEYIERLTADVANRTETATGQAHCFHVMELALQAQVQATRLGHLEHKN